MKETRTVAEKTMTEEERDCTCPDDWYSSTHHPSCAVVQGSNPSLQRYCRACGKSLRLENLFVDDGCPCNSPRGVNLTPQPCALCKTEHCVKPGHRIEAIWGFKP